jgi:hypothetical protein
MDFLLGFAKGNVYVPPFTTIPEELKIQMTETCPKNRPRYSAKKKKWKKVEYWSDISRTIRGAHNARSYVSITVLQSIVLSLCIS